MFILIGSCLPILIEDFGNETNYSKVCFAASDPPPATKNLKSLQWPWLCPLCRHFYLQQDQRKLITFRLTSKSCSLPVLIKRMQFTMNMLQQHKLLWNSITYKSLPNSLSFLIAKIQPCSSHNRHDNALKYTAEFVFGKTQIYTSSAASKLLSQFCMTSSYFQNWKSILKFKYLRSWMTLKYNFRSYHKKFQRCFNKWKTRWSKFVKRAVNELIYTTWMHEKYLQFYSSAKTKHKLFKETTVKTS